MPNNALESDHSLKAHYYVASSTVLSRGMLGFGLAAAKSVSNHRCVADGRNAFGWANASRFNCSASSFLTIILDNASSGPLSCSFKWTSDDPFRRKLGALHNIAMEEYAVEPWRSQRSQQTWRSTKLLQIGKKASILTLSARQILLLSSKLQHDSSANWNMNCKFYS